MATLVRRRMPAVTAAVAGGGGVRVVEGLSKAGARGRIPEVVREVLGDGGGVSNGRATAAVRLAGLELQLFKARRLEAQQRGRETCWLCGRRRCRGLDAVFTAVLLVEVVIVVEREGGRIGASTRWERAGLHGVADSIAWDLGEPEREKCGCSPSGLL